MTNLEAQCGYLKVKGEAPTFFKTYHLEDSGAYEERRNILREINFDKGWLLNVHEVIEELTFQPASVYEPDEPESFFE